MLVMELARRGSLRTALQGEEGRRELRWGAR